MPIPVNIQNFRDELGDIIIPDDNKVSNDMLKPNVNHGPYQCVPRCAYIYVFRMIDNLPRVDHYFYPGNDHEQKITSNPLPTTDDLVVLGNTISDALKTVTAQAGSSNFESMVWKHISYICMILDVDDWQFDDPLIAFKNGTAGYAYNKSFFDGKPIKIKMPNGDKRTALIFINHMIGQDGKILPEHSNPDPFDFKLAFRIRFSGSFGTAMWLLDPTGTNQGPPLDPPAP